MKKNIKRLSCAFLAIALCAVLAFPAFAAGSSGVPDSSKDGQCSITLTKHQVDATHTAGDKATGLPLDPGSPIHSYPTLDGVPFLFELVEAETGKTGSSDPDDYKVVMDTQPTPEPVYSKTFNTANGGKINVTGLNFGIYRVTELESDNVKTKVKPFLVKLPMTHPTEKGEWLYDVYVYPKNVAEIPDVDKKPGSGVEDPSGNIVPWTISVDVPKGIADAQKFVVTDTLDKRLSYIDGSCSAYITDKDGTKTVLTSSHFNSAKTQTGTAPNLQDLLTVTFTDYDELAKALNGTGSDKPQVHIEFKTIVSKLSEAELGSIPNGAELDFKDKDGNEFKPKDPTPPTVNVGGIKIHKIDPNATGVQELDGASFKIYTKESDALAGTNAVQEPGVTPSKDWVVTTVGGFAEFTGLVYGTYWLVETEQPSGGYNLLDKPVMVVVDATSYSTAKVVENHKGFTLPETGGRGTIIFTLCGLLLIAVGGTIFMVSSKKRKMQQ